MLFYIPLLVSVILILSVPVYPFVDGAAHLYNSKIIKELLFNSTTPFADFYEFNKVIVPNWLDHILLVFLMLIFTPLWSYKIFLVILVVSQALLFHKIILKLKPENQLLSCLVLPFIFGLFFHGGLYNQQLSLVILYAFIYWLILSDIIVKQGLPYYFGLLIFSLFFWFSSIITYAVFIILSGLLLLIKSYFDKINLINFLKKLGSLVLVFLPTIFLSLSFISKVHMVTNEKPIELLDKLILFLRIEPLVVFDTPGESRFLIPLGIILLLIGLSGLKTKSVNHRVILAAKLCTLILVVAFFIIPNEAGAGLLSFRFAMLIYLLILIVIVSMSLNRIYMWISAILVVCIHFGLTFKKHNGRVKSYAVISNNFMNVGKQIPKGSTVWPVSFSDNWFLGHSNNLAGIPNSTIVIENYETFYPWFPLRFKSDKQKLNDLYNQLRLNKTLNQYFEIPAEYIIVSGLNESDTTGHHFFINNLNLTEMVYQTPDSSMKLYKLRNN